MITPSKAGIAGFGVLSRHASLDVTADVIAPFSVVSSDLRSEARVTQNYSGLNGSDYIFAARYFVAQVSRARRQN